MARTTPGAERVVIAYQDVRNDRDYVKIVAVVSVSFGLEGPAAGETRGRDGLYEEAFIRDVEAGFPDFRVVILDLVAGETPVMDEAGFTMTYEGEFDGVPPGRAVAFRGRAGHSVEDGKLQARRQYYERHDVLAQLGLADD